VAEEAGNFDFPDTRFLGRYLRKSKPEEHDFFPDKFSVSGKAFRCGPISPEGKLCMQAYLPAKLWDYDLAVAKESRNRKVSDEELKAGLIIIGECSPGVDSWARWKVRTPVNLNVKVGDYIEAVVGVSDGYRSGSLSEAKRKVEKPSKEDFILTQGSYTVGCGAHSEALDE